MTLVQKISFYRNLFIVVLIANVFCITSGVVVSVFHWREALATGDSVYPVQLMWIGALTGVFGVFLPVCLIFALSRKLKEAKQRLDHQISQ